MKVTYQYNSGRTVQSKDLLIHLISGHLHVISGVHAPGVYQNGKDKREDKKSAGPFSSQVAPFPSVLLFQDEYKTYKPQDQQSQVIVNEIPYEDISPLLEEPAHGSVRKQRADQWEQEQDLSYPQRDKGCHCPFSAGCFSDKHSKDRQSYGHYRHIYYYDYR